MPEQPAQSAEHIILPNWRSISVRTADGSQKLAQLLSVEVTTLNCDNCLTSASRTLDLSTSGRETAKERERAGRASTKEIQRIRESF